MHSARVHAPAALAVFLAALCLSAPAHAYVGEQTLNFAANWLIGPLALLALVVALVAYFFDPNAMRKAINVCIVSIVVFAVIKAGNAIIGTFQAG